MTDEQFALEVEKMAQAPGASPELRDFARAMRADPRRTLDRFLEKMAPLIFEVREDPDCAAALDSQDPHRVATALDARDARARGRR